MSFLRIVEDLMTSKKLRAQFNQDPDGFIKEYGLRSQARAVLLTMDWQEIAKKVPPEVRPDVSSFQMQNNEFLPVSEDFFAEDGGLDPQYPSPSPGIFRFRPHAISAAAKTTKSFELVVFGQSFVDAKLELVRKADGAMAPSAHEFRIGTFRCTILRAIFSPIAADGMWKPNDKFEVRVINNPGATGLEKTHVAQPLLMVEA